MLKASSSATDVYGNARQDSKRHINIYKNIFAIGSTQQQMMIISYFPSSSSTRYHSISDPVCLSLNPSIVVIILNLNLTPPSKCV